jgi:hypothetical protein
MKTEVKVYIENLGYDGTWVTLEDVSKGLSGSGRTFDSAVLDLCSSIGREEFERSLKKTCTRRKRETPRKGWLERQAKSIKKEIDSWPDSVKRDFGVPLK